MIKEFVGRCLAHTGRILLPVRPNEKATRYAAWSAPDARPAPDDFSEGDNVAERLDQIVDVDADCAEAQKACAALLPPTPRKHGRPSLGIRHFWYAAPGSKPESFKDVDGSTLIEIRTGAGQYTLIPPSRVPRKDNPSEIEELFWCDDADAAPVSAEGLRKLVVMVATAALLARHWPKSGRHDAACYASGFLAARNLDAREVEEIIGTAAEIAGDEEVKDRKRAARDTHAEFTAGKPTTGAPSLEDVINKKAVTRLNKWWGKGQTINTAEAEARIERRNERYAALSVGNKVVVAEFSEGQIVELWPFEEFRKKLIKEPAVGRQPYADYWLKHEKGRHHNRAEPPNCLNGCASIGVSHDRRRQVLAHLGRSGYRCPRNNIGCDRSVIRRSAPRMVVSA